MFFFEKKNQKTFGRLGPCTYPELVRRPKLTKFFCFFLFTKRRLLASLRLAASVVALVGSADDALAARTPLEVVQHHIAEMLKHDGPALASDYADDAVVVFANGVVSGDHQVQKFFKAMGARQPAVDDHARFKVASVNGDVVVEDWSHLAPGGGTVSGADVIVVRDGEIVFHATEPPAAAAVAK